MIRFLETENGKRKTENDLLIRQLRRLLPDLDLTLADLRPEPKNHRKISEKLAKNQRKIPRGSLKIANKIINIRQVKKNYRKTSLSGQKPRASRRLG